MQNWRSVAQEPTAESLILSLAVKCDNASTTDALGFSKMDAQYGHGLAYHAQQGKPWSVKQAQIALKLIQKYSRQLGGKAWVQDWIKQPNFTHMPRVPVPEKNIRMLISMDQQAVFKFKYNAELIQDIKQIKGQHKGKHYYAKYKPEQKEFHVEVNERSIFQIMQVARNWEFDIESRFEIYYTKVVQKLDQVKSAAEESRISTSLGYDPQVIVDGTHMQITHADPHILAEFQQVLQNLS